MEGIFAFITTPASVEQAPGCLPLMQRRHISLRESLLRFLPPRKQADITGLRSAHAAARGCIINVNLSPAQLPFLSPTFVLKKIIRSGRLAERMGARIVGLDAALAASGDGGVTVSRNLNIAVTNGNSCAVAAYLESGRFAAELMGLEWEEAAVTVAGLADSLAAVLAQSLARDGVNRLTLTAGDCRRMESLSRRIIYDSGVSCKITADVAAAVRRSDLLFVFSTAAAHICSNDVQPGAVVYYCNDRAMGALPMVQSRSDVLVVDGAVIEAPGGLTAVPAGGKASRYLCASLAETMILALERRMENYSLGRDLRMGKVWEMRRLAVKHGFRFSGLRCLGRPITEAAISRIKGKALWRRKGGLSS